MPQRPVIPYDEASDYFAPARDFVNLPRPETSGTPGNRYAVTSREPTHAAGRESRLNRVGVAGGRLAALGSAATRANSR